MAQCSRVTIQKGKEVQVSKWDSAVCREYPAKEFDKMKTAQKEKEARALYQLFLSKLCGGKVRSFARVNRGSITFLLDFENKTERYEISLSFKNDRSPGSVMIHSAYMVAEIDDSVWNASETTTIQTMAKQYLKESRQANEKTKGLKKGDVFHFDPIKVKCKEKETKGSC